MSRLRSRTPVGILALGCIVAAMLALCWGETFVSPLTAARALFGADIAGVSFPLVEFRLPRVVNALVTGAAFGLAGAVLQDTIRNPLASPDLLGVNAGASAAAVAALAWGGWSGTRLSLAALAGGAGTAVLVYLMAGRGGLHTSRFILTGIGAAAFLGSLVTFLLTKISMTSTQQAFVWLTGSLSSTTWPRVAAVAATCALSMVALWALNGTRLALQLGPETASSLGVRPGIATALIGLFGVLPAAAATASAGPILFVAFMAAPLARRLMPNGRGALGTAMLVGATLVVCADVLAQRALPGTALPVGVVTAALGAPYLVWAARRVGESGTGGQR